MKAEEIIQKLTKNGLDYRSSDFKAEVHIFGQIVGASNIADSNGMFCEAFFEAGTDWQLLSPPVTIQTQTAYNDVSNIVTFAHPFDLHYTTHNIFGWPKLTTRVWKLDETNKVDLVSYGTVTLPNSAGFHEIEFDTWMLKGSLQQETLGFFLDTNPKMNIADPVSCVSSNLDLRKLLITKPGPKIHLQIEVMLRNFSFHSISGQ